MVTFRVNNCIQPFLHPALLRERKRRRAEFLMESPASALAEYQMISGHHEVRQSCSGQKKTRVLEENLQTPSSDIGILYPDKKEVKRFSAKKQPQPFPSSYRDTGGSPLC